MAASVVTAHTEPAKNDVTERWAIDAGYFSVAAGDYTNGTGLVVDLSAACRSARPPVRVEVWSETSGNTYGFVVGTLKSNGHLRCFVAGVECSTAATPASVTGDTIYYRIWRKKA